MRSRFKDSPIDMLFILVYVLNLDGEFRGSSERCTGCSAHCGRPYFGKGAVSMTRVEVMFGTPVGLSSTAENI